ncbi:MAG: alpha-glucosidase [Erysipelotrichaceae bacterium]|nr:alpha-glucosidase [Erysipelotrichaceae bacterium]
MNKTDWYKNAIVYQIYPYSFKDSNNDGIGDIKGIISKLDYLKDLGVNAIWFSPLYKTGYYDYGYDISDYYSINPDTGSMEDFDNLLNECHSRDMKVIMDMVINHTSIDHPWFKEAIADKNSPYRDYYIIQKGKIKDGKISQPTNWKSTFTGSAWEHIEGTDEYYLHLFCKEQADLNWENPSVREEVKKILRFWLDKGVDGFRFDVFNMFSKVWPLKDDEKKHNGECYFIDGPRMHEFLKELNDEVFSKYDCFTVGESYKPSPENATAYVNKDNHELDAIFNFAHLDCDNISKFFPLPFSLKKFKEGLFSSQREGFKNGWNTLVIENHDNIRSVSRFGINTDKYRYEAATFLSLITFFGFGTPFIYQGEEIGMTSAPFKSIDEMNDPVSHFVYDMITGYGMPKSVAFKFVNGGARDHARTPMQWNSSTNAGFNEGAKPWQMINPNYKDINVENDLKSDKSIYRFYQSVINLKKTKPVLRDGDIREYNHNHRQIIAYSRNDEIFVLGNFSSRTVKYKLPEEFGESDILLKNYPDLNKENEELILRPYEAIAFEKKKEA